MNFFFSGLVFIPMMLNALFSPLREPEHFAIDACRYDAVEVCGQEEKEVRLLCKAGDCSCHKKIEDESFFRFNDTISTGKMIVKCEE